MILAMKYLTTYFLIFTGVLFSNSCKKPPIVDFGEEVVIENKSQVAIRFYIPDLKSQFPDTSLPVKKPNLRKILPSDYFIDFLKSPDKKSYFEHLPADTLSVFFIDNAIYDNEPWDSIRVNYQILRRLDLSIEDLKANNYTIKYP